jgi:hypothetical protein
LDVVEISNVEDFYDNIIKEEQALYYMMANTSLKDAIESVDSKDYFGFDIPSDKVKDNILQPLPMEESYNFEAINEEKKTRDRLYKLEDEVEKYKKEVKDLRAIASELKGLLKNAKKENKKEIEEKIENTENKIEKTTEKIENTENKIEKTKEKSNDLRSSILTKKLFPNDKTKKYFLTFDGAGNELFDILHKDFKSEIFTGDTYVKKISTDRKLTIFKIIHDVLKIGEDVAKQLAEYLVGLEAHMLLDNKDSWFVVKNNTELIETEKCFIKDSDKIVNKDAFVEISQNEYNEIKKFLDGFHKLSKDDFFMEDEEIEEK